MKTLVLLFLLPLPSFAAALPWSELAPGAGLRLSQEVLVGESGPKFSPGTRLDLLSVEALEIPGAPVLLLTLDQRPCAEPRQKTEIEIVLPEGNPESSSVGIEIAEGCRWSVYLEQKDLLQPSLFERSE